MAIINIGESQTFTYTGAVQTLDIQVTGLYKLEVYGSKGENGSVGSGGNGGYSMGYKVIEAGTTLYIACGGQNWNGGGTRGTWGSQRGGVGGGATHIATMDGTLVFIGQANLDKVLIIAGGGGGGSGDGNYYGGTGGGATGGNGQHSSYSGKGGTQTTGGARGSDNVGSNGSFGQGGNKVSNDVCGGGGGGLYGGGAGYYSGGGGSGYIDNVPEVTYMGETYSPVTTNGANTTTGTATITLEAVEPSYEITLTYDSTLGSASYYWNGNNVVLEATPNSSSQFIGWYINSVPLSSSSPYTYTPTGDVTIEARFDQIYTITDSVSGSGSLQYTRGQDQNDVTFSVIPNANWHFLKYEVNGMDYTTTPLSLHLTEDTTVVAVFEENGRYHITANTNFDYGSIYLSDNDVYEGTDVTAWARPFPDYYFVRWSDGETTNPRTITVTADITLVAIYQRAADTNGIYQYRCYIKDQMSLTDPPKAFMRVDTFDIKTDLLTNANSTINVLDTAQNVNNGDVLVLYDPKGTTLYQGVVKSMEDSKIICSQMQSFYKGTWIYNTSAQDFLEHEIAVLLQNYADGKIYKSTYIDPLVAQRLSGITIDYIGTTAVNLPTDLDDEGKEKLTTKDMEKWIYELYENYGIVFDFEINMSGTNYVHIKVPSYSPVKVGNNMFAIKDMSPITTIEEKNRLIIFNSDKTYRTTYVATKNGIVQAPTSTANRFDITNTTVVFSDDPDANLVASNLPETMYNHKLTFTLLIKNFIFEFGEFNLGGELDVWKGSDYYNSVLTGYQIKKESNQNIVSVDFTCGKVRTALTKLLTMGGTL